MKVDWKNPIKCEQLMAEILQEMVQYGWLVDKDRIITLINDLKHKMQLIENDVLPQIPLKPVNEKEVKKPFLKDGGYAKITKDWYTKQGLDPILDHTGDAGPVVAGPFTRLSWQPINLGSDKQVKEYLLSIGWIPLEWNTSKKKETWGQRTSPKLTEESYASLSTDIGKQISTYMVYKHRKSLLSGLLDHIRPDGRISQRISGLTPTFRYKHKVVVNIPGSDAVYGAECRSVFVAKPGYKIVGSDAKSCQLRMLCNYMGDDEYTEAVVNGKKEDGTDIHTVNMHKAGLITKTDAKRFIYAFLFGAGDEKLGSILSKNAHVGARLRAQFLTNLPRLQNLLDKLKKTLRRGYMVGLDGRKIYARAEHMLLVYLLQGAEAILMKYAIIFAIHQIKKEKLDAHLVCVMHDEMQFEVREDQAARVAEICPAAIRRASSFLGLKVPADGDSAIGNHWGETH